MSKTEGGGVHALKQAYASPYGKLSLIVLAFLLIWLDQRRITRQKNKPSQHDETTLEGRVHKLIEDMQQFVTEMGAKPEWTAQIPTVLTGLHFGESSCNAVSR